MTLREEAAAMVRGRTDDHARLLYVRAKAVIWAMNEGRRVPYELRLFTPQWFEDMDHRIGEVAFSRDCWRAVAADC